MQGGMAVIRHRYVKFPFKAKTENDSMSLTIHRLIDSKCLSHKGWKRVE